MVMRLSLAVTVFTALVLALSVQRSAADFVVSSHDSGVNRISDDGSLLLGYVPPAHLDPEAFGQTHAVSHDGNVVYGFTNSLGFSDIIAFDSETGAYLPDQTILLPGCCGSLQENFVFKGSQAL